MKYFLSTLVIIFFITGTAVAANINQYKGKWINTDKNTRGVTKIIFSIDGGGKASVHVWGKCSPQDCDWGWKNCNSYLDGHLSARFRNDFSIKNLTINLISQGKLKVKVHTRFTDNSGRPERENTYTFRRLLKPVTQTPKPIN
jgi:hypothetical protein